MSYLIKITDKVNNSHEIIYCETSFESYNDSYIKIYESLNSNKDLTLNIKDDNNTKNATISKYTTVKNKGYLYNTTSNTTIILYELSLIKINTDLSSLFISESEVGSEVESEVESESQVKTYDAIYNHHYPDNDKFNDKFKPQSTSWSPLLMDELRNKLSLPNSGLNNSSNYFFLD